MDKLKESAKSGKGNLLALAVDAAQARATLGEISDALESVYGRYVPNESIVRGAYLEEATSIEGSQGKKEFE